MKVLVVDDHPVYREGLVGVLRDRGFDVVGEAADGAGTLEAVSALAPDLVLMDLAMPGMSGLEATRALAVTAPEVVVVVLTMSDDDSVLGALRAGARGYLLKGSSADEIVAAMAAAAAGQTVLHPNVSRHLVGAAGRFSRAERPLPQLTERELELLDLVARGQDNASIARQLVLSEKTVRNYLSMILTKLPALSRAEAVARARDAGLGIDRTASEASPGSPEPVAPPTGV